LEDSWYGLACECASGGDSGGLDRGEDVSVGRLGGRAFELLGEQEGLFKDEGSQGRFGLKRTG
jgi:hypothetical protein